MFTGEGETVSGADGDLEVVSDSGGDLDAVSGSDGENDDVSGAESKDIISNSLDGEKINMIQFCIYL